ncbi:hypothetical protein JB92DRAFT_3118183 [Gautieria morchelliformis]|nr:hypothetical protein JB92DRAFT_3118183 [Gautieria morchelliformis]
MVSQHLITTIVAQLTTVFSGSDHLVREGEPAKQHRDEEKLPRQYTDTNPIEGCGQPGNRRDHLPSGPSNSADYESVGKREIHDHRLIEDNRYSRLSTPSALAASRA